MRHLTLCLALLLALPTLAPTRAAAQGTPPNAPPHSWLFGTWTGGLFPVSGTPNTQACFSQPVVIFTRDLVMRATLTQQQLTQREIETARAVPGGIEFHFVGAPGRDSGLLGLGGGALAGFGCENNDVLRVQRRGENEITFPGCAEFPNPLVRCH